MLSIINVPVPNAINLSVKCFENESYATTLPTGFARLDGSVKAVSQVFQHLLLSGHLYIAKLKDPFRDANEYTVTVNA